MKQVLNTLYVTTERSFVRLDHDTLRVEVEGECKIQVPLLHIGALVLFGNVIVSTPLIHKCAEEGREIVFLNRDGRFKARVVGPTSGNVLLRQAQYSALMSKQAVLSIAKSVVAGKLHNSRQVTMRAARETSESDDANALHSTAERIQRVLTSLRRAETLDQVRGIEGEGARAYFDTFDRMVLADRNAFSFASRSKRPPRDRMNALISFIYMLVMNDCVAAAEGVGLDPQAGFLHALRPGRPSLALDLMEELRAPIADRLALALVNRAQITKEDFIERPGGAINLDDAGRREVIVGYQKKKQDEILHHLLNYRVPVGLFPHVQARLLARTLRGDTAEYIPARFK